VTWCLLDGGGRRHPALGAIAELIGHLAGTLSPLADDVGEDRERNFLWRNRADMSPAGARRRATRSGSSPPQ
jgi:hypothetical protein